MISLNEQTPLWNNTTKGDCKNMNRRYWVTVAKNDYDKAEPILSKMYEEGVADSIREDWSGDGVMLGVECASDDLLIMKLRFKENGITFH